MTVATGAFATPEGERVLDALRQGAVDRLADDDIAALNTHLLQPTTRRHLATIAPVDAADPLNRDLHLMDAVRACPAPQTHASKRSAPETRASKRSAPETRASKRSEPETCATRRSAPSLVSRVTETPSVATAFTRASFARRAVTPQ